MLEIPAGAVDDEGGFVVLGLDIGFAQAAASSATPATTATARGRLAGFARTPTETAGAGRSVGRAVSAPAFTVRKMVSLARTLFCSHDGTGRLTKVGPGSRRTVQVWGPGGHESELPA